MSNRVIFAVLLCVSCLARAEDVAIAQLFDDEDVTGTLVIASVNTDRRFVHNDARAEQPFVAASTFKILNTLIAVEEGATGGADDILRWDGTRYEIADWNRDQSSKTAFKVSCVWCYQALAKRVGAQAYRSYLRQAGYGQLREPLNGSTFWLDGTLTGSADDLPLRRQIALDALRIKGILPQAGGLARAARTPTP